MQGTGEAPVRDGAQVGGTLRQTVEIGRLVFNLPLHVPYWYFLPRDHAFGSVFSSADGAQYSVMAQAPPWRSPPTATSPSRGYTLGPHVNRDFLLARYTATGSLDTSFGDHGTVKSDLGGGDDFAENLLVDTHGRIVLVGRAGSATILDMALVRYSADGTLDTGFDGDGIITADFHGRAEFGQDLALDAAGRIVAAGYTANGADTEFALLRTNP